MVPHCGICNKGFGTVIAHLSDQFRCQIYDMTERGLVVHVRNHGRKGAETHTPTSTIDNSATDDSDV